MNNTPIIIPDHIQDISDKYKNAGYECHIVGGYLRDHFMGHDSNDIDLATNAPLDVTKELFSTASIGEDHGTLLIKSRVEPIEVTRFRSDISTDGRHANIEFADTIEEDLSRRDFTFNAMAFDVQNKVLIDPFNGKDDAINGHIEFVGDTTSRILEDHLRAIRFYRFIHKYNLTFNPSDTEAVLSVFSTTALSQERIIAEFNKMFSTSQPSKDPSTIINHLTDLNILPIFNVENNPGLIEDIFNMKSLYPLVVHKCEINHNLNQFPISKMIKKATVLFLRTVDDNLNFIISEAKGNKDVIVDVLNLRKFYNIADELDHYIKMTHSDMPMLISDLDINGKDLLSIGISGKPISLILYSVLLDIQDGSLINSKKDILNSNHITDYLNKLPSSNVFPIK
jgi:tRNA nucleotidyltransferase/poly(A) polymerase